MVICFIFKTFIDFCIIKKDIPSIRKEIRKIPCDIFTNHIIKKLRGITTIIKKRRYKLSKFALLLEV